MFQQDGSHNRLVEYFCVVGLDAETAERQASGLPPMPNPLDDPGGGMEMHPPSEGSLPATVLDRFPLVDHDNSVFPYGVSMFCFPDGVKAVDEMQLPKFFQFVLTGESGQHMHGFAFIIYEPVTLSDKPVSDNVGDMESKGASASNRRVRDRRRRRRRKAAIRTDHTTTEKKTVIVSGGGDSDATNVTDEEEEEDAGSSDDDDVNATTVTDPSDILQGSSAAAKAQTSGNHSPLETQEEGDEVDDDKCYEDEDDIEEEEGNIMSNRVDTIPCVVYMPKCLCLLSYWPYGTNFRKFLVQLYRLSLSPITLPLEFYVTCFARDVPMPPPSVLVQHRIADLDLVFGRPPANNPISWIDLPFQRIFECLDLENIITIVACILCERPVLFTSSQLSLLSGAGEVFLAFIYPFSWAHVYIPVLPASLAMVLQAPLPYIIGVESDILTRVHEMGFSIPDTTVQVHLDANFVSFSHALPVPCLPTHEHKKLLSQLERCAPAFVNRSPTWAVDELPQMDMAVTQAARPTDVIDIHALEASRIIAQQGESSTGTEWRLLPSGQCNWLMVRTAFFRLHVSLLRDYNDFVILAAKRYKDAAAADDDASSSTTSRQHVDNDFFSQPRFDEQGFLSKRKARDKDFFTQLLNTQHFHVFIDERVHPDGQRDADVLFFSQSIQAKTSRSLFGRMTFLPANKARDTTFLDDVDKYKYSHTVVTRTADSLLWDPETSPMQLGVTVPHFYETFPSLQHVICASIEPPVRTLVPQNLGLAKVKLGNKDRDALDIERVSAIVQPQEAVLASWFVLYCAAVGIPSSPLLHRWSSFDLDGDYAMSGPPTPYAPAREGSGGGTGSIIGNSTSPQLSPQPGFAIGTPPSSPVSRRPPAAMVQSTIADTAEAKNMSQLPPQLKLPIVSRVDTDQGIGGQTSAPSSPTAASRENESKNIVKHGSFKTEGRKRGSLTLTFANKLMGRNENASGNTSPRSPRLTPNSNTTPRDSRTEEEQGGRGSSSIRPHARSLTNAASFMSLHSIAAEAMLQKNHEEWKREQAIGLLHVAFDVLEASRESGVNIDQVVYRALIDACGRCGDLDHAIKLLGTMHEAGVKADSRTYSNLIQAFSLNATNTFQMGMLSWEHLKQEVEAANKRIMLKARNSRTREEQRRRGGSSSGRRQKYRRENENMSKPRIQERLLRWGKTGKRNSIDEGSGFGSTGRRKRTGMLPRQSEQDAVNKEAALKAAALTERATARAKAAFQKRVLAKEQEHGDASYSNGRVISATLSGNSVTGFHQHDTQRYQHSRTSTGMSIDTIVSLDPAESGQNSADKLMQPDKRTAVLLEEEEDEEEEDEEEEEEEESVFKDTPLELMFLNLRRDADGEVCPQSQCSTVLTDADVRRGWRPDPNDYTTCCPKCKRRFVAVFTLTSDSPTWEGSTGVGTPLFCQFLPPWVLVKEVHRLLQNRGITSICAPEFRSQSTGLFWNLVIYFCELGLPVGFLVGIGEDMSSGGGAAASGTISASAMTGRPMSLSLSRQYSDHNPQEDGGVDIVTVENKNSNFENVSLEATSVAQLVDKTKLDVMNDDGDVAVVDHDSALVAVRQSRASHKRRGVSFESIVTETISEEQEQDAHAFNDAEQILKIEKVVVAQERQEKEAEENGDKGASQRLYSSNDTDENKSSDKNTTDVPLCQDNNGAKSLSTTCIPLTCPVPNVPLAEAPHPSADPVLSTQDEAISATAETADSSTGSSTDTGASDSIAAAVNQEVCVVDSNVTNDEKEEVEGHVVESAIGRAQVHAESRSISTKKEVTTRPLVTTQTANRSNGSMSSSTSPSGGGFRSFGRIGTGSLSKRFGRFLRGTTGGGSRHNSGEST